VTNVIEPSPLAQSKIDPVQQAETNPAIRKDFSQDMRRLAVNNQESFSSESEAYNSLIDGKHDEFEHMEASGTIVPNVSHTRTQSRETAQTKPSGFSDTKTSAVPAVTGAFLDPNEQSFIVSDFFPSEAEVDDPQAEPFTLLEMLKQLLAYHTTALSDAQASSHFLLLLLPLLAENQALPAEETDATISIYTEALSGLHLSDETIYTILDVSLTHLIKAGVQPLQIEGILSTYHDQLQSLGLLHNAAYLRRLCYPSFPAVYEQGLKDNSVRLRCGGCRKPINNPRNKLRCENCTRRAAPCPICWCAESPFENNGKRKRHTVALPHDKTHEKQINVKFEVQENHIGDEESKHGLKIRPQLYSTCLNCNHAAHASCLAIWHGETPSGVAPGAESEQVCPTPGCLCVCVAPKTTPAVSIGDANRRRASGTPHAGGTRESVVREDDWRIRESSAVGSARRSLGGDDSRRSGTKQ
jgi:hypothetical protein